MAAKTFIGTGTAGGLGLEVIKQLLLDQPQSYRFILGVRNPSAAAPAYDAIKYDKNKHQLSLLQCDFSDLSQVKRFASEALDKLGNDKLDYVFMNHAVVKNASSPGPKKSQYNEQYVVNHLSQHYLMHLLRPTIEKSNTRVVFVSSGAIRQVKDTGSLLDSYLATSTAEPGTIYGTTKFAQLLGAHWWRRTLGSKATVVAVSPGMIPGTGLGRNFPDRPPNNSPDAKDIPTGGRSLIAALERNDIPKDPNTIFLTSWGEWWDPNEIYPLSLDAKLQDEFCPPVEVIEKEQS